MSSNRFHWSLPAAGSVHVPQRAVFHCRARAPHGHKTGASRETGGRQGPIALDPCDCLLTLACTCAAPSHSRVFASLGSSQRPAVRFSSLPPYATSLGSDVMVAFVASPLLGGRPYLPHRASQRGLSALRPPIQTPTPRSRVRMALPTDASCPLPPPPADAGRRRVLNLLLVGAAAPVVFGVLGLYGSALAPPPRAGGGGGGRGGGVETTGATDVDGAPVTVAALVAAAPADGRKTMVVGVGGEPAWLTAAPPDRLDHFALCAVCTHMGCVVPWVPARGRYVCPCHASEYDRDGRVLRGPAPLPLKLEHATVEEEGGAVLLSTWTEDDFRTGKAPWWSA